MLHRNISKQSDTRSYYSENQIASVLSACNVKVGGEIDTHFMIYCPFHYNVNTPACEIDKESGLFICFSCGESGGLIDLVTKTTNRNYFEAIRMINSKKLSNDIASVVDSSLDKKVDIVEFDALVIKRLNQTLMSSSRGIEYFESRGINNNSMRELELGYSMKQDMVIVPVHDHHGMCVGFVARSLEGKSFKNSVNLPKKQILFNLHRVKFSDITVVESSFDAIRLYQLGIPAVASLGATPSKRQIELLSKYATSINVCPDKDDAGKKMVSRIMDGITSKPIRVIDVGSAKDVGDLSDEQIKEIWNNSGVRSLIAI